MRCIELPHRGVNLYLSIDSLVEGHVGAVQPGRKVSADPFIAGVEPGFAGVIERVTFHHDMVLAERIPNGLVIDAGERLERLHGRHANIRPPGVERAMRLLSTSRGQSARTYASADKLGNGAGNGFGPLQQQKVSRTRQVDKPDALAELLAERVAIPGGAASSSSPWITRSGLFRRP